MSTKTWTLAPSGYLQTRELGARPVVSGECGRDVSQQAPVGGSGLSVAAIGVPMRTAAPFGAPVSTPDFRFNGTTLGIPSSRRPSS